MTTLDTRPTNLPVSRALGPANHWLLVLKEGASTLRCGFDAYGRSQQAKAVIARAEADRDAAIAQAQVRREQAKSDVERARMDFGDREAERAHVRQRRQDAEQLLRQGLIRSDQFLELALPSRGRRA